MLKKIFKKDGIILFIQNEQEDIQSRLKELDDDEKRKAYLITNSSDDDTEHVTAAASEFNQKLKRINHQM